MESISLQYSFLLLVYQYRVNSKEVCRKIVSINDAMYLSRTNDYQTILFESVFLEIYIQATSSLLYETKEIIVVSMRKGISV